MRAVWAVNMIGFRLVVRCSYVDLTLIVFQRFSKSHNFKIQTFKAWPVHTKPH